MPIPVTSELTVNSSMAGDQTPTDTAALSGGATVVTWLDGTTAKLRLFGPAGTSLTQEVTVGAASEIQLATLPGGGFVAVWISSGNAPASVMAQTYSAAGAAIGGPVTLMSYAIAGTPTMYLHPLGLDLTALSDGGYQAAWSVHRADALAIQTLSTQLVVINASGNVEASVANTVVGSSRSLVAYDPQVTSVELAGGHVLVTWRQAPTPLGEPSAQFGQLYDLNGVAVGGQIRLDASIPADGGPTIDASQGLAAAALPGGSVAFVWKANDTIWTSLYPADHLGQGNLTGRSQPLAVGSATGAGEPQVAVLADGRYVVAWSDHGDALARMYSVAGAPLGDAFRVGDIAAGVQDWVDIVVRPDGDLVVVWRDDSHLAAPGQATDASGTAVKAQVLIPGDTGGVGHNDVTGTGGGEVLTGGAGEDWLLAGGGAETLSGGAGADRFVLTLDGAADRLLDFSRAEGDRIDLLDGEGHQLAGGLLTLTPATGALSWDSDGGAGPLAPVAMATLGVASLDRQDFAPGFRPAAVRVLTADGGREDTVFDWSGQAFERTVGVFDRIGSPVSYTVSNDNGGSAIHWWDSNATETWAVRAADYDPAGRITAYGVTYDDGHQVVWQFDTTGRYAWTRMIDTIDALGRQAGQAVAWDDGTAFERYHDTYDTQPWAYYIDNYKDGTLLNHTFYRDDGTVFA